MLPLLLVALAAPAASQLTAEYRRMARPVGTVTFEDPSELELYDPRSLYPRLDGPRPELRALRDFGRRCEGQPPAVSRWPKAWRFAEARCARAVLEREFFEEPPFVHPLGGSYLARAMAEGLLAPTLKDAPPTRWLHVLELDAPGRTQDRHRAVDPFAAAAISTGQPVALGPHVVFLRREGEGPLRYDLYRRVDWDRWVERQTLRLVPASVEVGCVELVGTYCWVQPVEELTHDLAMLRRSFLGLVGIAGLVGLGLAGWLILLRVREARERSFVFQMLAHELRTPMASLALQVDALRRLYDELPGNAQTRVLEIAAQVARLRRLVEGSERYLGPAADRSPEPDAAVSVNALLASLADRRPGEVELMLLEADRALPADPFWIEVALKSLIENAFEHGRPPVVLSAEVRDAELVLEVADRGTRSKSRPGPGRGFGLRLVRRVADKAGGRLEALSEPTRFRLVVPARAR